MKFKIIIALSISVLLFLVYREMVSIPDIHLKSVTSFEDSMTRHKTSLAKNMSLFEASKKNDDWGFLSRYSEKENWEQSFSQSEIEIQKAQKIFDDKITPVIEKNHKDGVPILVQALHDGKKSLKAAASHSQYPEERAEFLLTARDKKDEYYSNSQDLRATAQDIVNKLKKATVVYREKYPKKDSDIEEKFKSAGTMLNVIDEHYGIIEEEYQSTTPDYAIYGDVYASLNKQHAVLEKYTEDIHDLLNQLDRSYVKVLSDQKADNFVIIGRASWCEGEYCGEGDQIFYPPVQVDSNTFEYFEETKLNIIATKRGNRLSTKIPKPRWNALGISPSYRWDNNYYYAEYWVEKTESKTYHKYTILEDGKVNELPWQAVSNDLFWAHQEHLGMAIVSKPIGSYESEAILTAEPVGMAMIATPAMVNGKPVGSNQYGEWRHSGGQSFFYYYGMYRMFGSFITPGRYYYSDWNGYRSHGRRSAYYGRGAEYGTYGSATYSNPRYSNTSYSKRNPKIITEAKTGRSSKTQGSIRGAGSSSRSKGPSGGGK